MPSKLDIQYKEADALAKIFLVEPKYIKTVPHPTRHGSLALEIEYIAGLNIPPAVAEFLNQEVYDTPRGNKISVHAPNDFAFVQQNDRGRFLYVSMNRPLDQLIQRLNEHIVEIHRVIEDPDSKFLPKSAAALIHNHHLALLR
jgi:hypothetical protein